MDAVKNDVKRLVKIELAAANKKFRMFAGPHEGAGIIQEEVVEAVQEMNGLRQELNAIMRVPYRAEQVWLTIRHALAWHDKPEGDPWNVCFDKPLNRSDQPQPVVKLNEKQEAKKK